MKEEMNTIYNKYERINESLPRQSTVDQLKRIRDEINKSQIIKVGPEETTMSGDVGDRVISDLIKHKGKQEMNNLFWWDNPLDRHIDSYETFVRDDSRDSLGYTKDGDPKTHKGTDYVKENIKNNKIKMNRVKRFSDILNESRDFEPQKPKISYSYAKKLLKFHRKIQHLFSGIDLYLTLPEIRDMILSSNPEKFLDQDTFKEVKAVVDANKSEIQAAYDEVFGVREEFFVGLLISVVFGLAFYYAFSRGYFDKLFAWVDRKIHPNRYQDGYGGGGCASGRCGGDEWKTAKAKKLPPPVKRTTIDDVLDKIGKRGMDSLNAEEKEILRRSQRK
jgi:hypothetical protein